MKRSIIIAAMFLAGSVSVVAQSLPVYPIDVRKPDLYYYTGNWVDSSYINHPDSTIYTIGVYYWGTYDCYTGRTCVTPQPLRIIGIAGAVSIDNTSLSPSLDTITTPRVPEYFQLYQHEGDSIFFVDETCWDAAMPGEHWDASTSQTYDIEFPRLSVVNIVYENATVHFTESFFDKPIMVHDTFYVGGTTHNNMLYGVSDVFPAGGWLNEHYKTLYVVLSNKSNIGESLPYAIPPNPDYFIMKYFWPHQTHYSLTNWGGDPGIDTSQFFIKTAGPWFLFFPIIDTNYIPGVGTYSDSCLAPTGLHLEAINDAGVILAWNAGGETLWQVAVAKEGVNMNDGLLITTPINYIAIENLEYGNWYKAQVRTICEDEVYGDWSAQIQFWYGDPNDSVSCATPVGLQVVSTGVGKAVLQWANNPEMLKWQVEYGTAATPVGSGTLVNAPMYFAALNGLEMEQWHWARVRAYCASDWKSLWTDTVMIYVPGDGSGTDTNGSDTTTVIDMVEMYTYLMPNPAREEVAVMSSFKVRSVELYASDGKLLKAQEVNAIGTQLSLEGLPAGVYFVRVRTTAGVTTKRLVVE